MDTPRSAMEFLKAGDGRVDAMYFNFRTARLL